TPSLHCFFQSDTGRLSSIPAGLRILGERPMVGWQGAPSYHPWRSTLRHRLGRLCSGFDLLALDPINDLQALGLRRDAVELLLPRDPCLHLLDKSVQVDKLALLERVVLGETHLLELGLA